MKQTNSTMISPPKKLSKHSAGNVIEPNTNLNGSISIPKKKPFWSPKSCRKADYLLENDKPGEKDIWGKPLPEVLTAKEILDRGCPKNIKIL